MDIVVSQDSEVKSSCKTIESNKSKLIGWYSAVSPGKLVSLKDSLASLFAKHGNNCILKELVIHCMLFIYHDLWFVILILIFLFLR